MLNKINFKQPKYIFPVVIFVPLCFLVYFVMQTFGGGEDKPTVATDHINSSLPEAHAEEAGDKLFEMSRRFGDEDAFTAVGKLGEEETDDEYIDHGYSEEELNRLDASVSSRNLKSLNAHLQSPAVISTRMLMIIHTIIFRPLTHAMNTHETLKQSSSAVMSVRKLSKPGLDMARMMQRNLLKSNEPTLSPKPRQ